MYMIKTAEGWKPLLSPMKPVELPKFVRLSQRNAVNNNLMDRFDEICGDKT